MRITISKEAAAAVASWQCTINCCSGCRPWRI